ncbi:MAG: hypothetical protein HYR60_33560, partial [Acidobacteria bacterium]|nr:hypothetical protein [Acidobacteriota bacterium]
MALADEELTAIIRGIRDRVRARYPGASTTDRWRIPLPDLMPIAHARDAAESKVAAIGKVNPRGRGPLNALAQLGKKIAARLLDWHVREQVEFNRHVLACVEATLQALNESNRTLVEVSARMDELAVLREEAQELKDIRGHWAEWRQEWERKLFINETQFLRSVADLQGAFQHR